MVSKNYQQELADLESGLNATKRLIAQCADRATYKKALKNKDIQEAQIDFFKRGYHFARREFGSQTTIKDIIKMSGEARSDMIKKDIQDTLSPMKKCIVCGILRPEGLFIRPCGKETPTCLICRNVPEAKNSGE